MKKLIVIAGALLLLTGTTMAGQAGLFSYDQESVSIEMAELNALEDFVSVNPGVTLNDLVAAENDLVANINGAESAYGFDLMYDKALGIGGF